MGRGLSRWEDGNKKIVWSDFTARFARALGRGKAAGDDASVTAGAPVSTRETPAPRARAWRALAQLFLDTELDDADITAIARELRLTGFSAAELQRIYEEEVAPICWRNLTVLPGGVWGGFNDDWLIASIQRRLDRQGARPMHPTARKLCIRWWTRATRQDWLRVRDRLRI